MAAAVALRSVARKIAARAPSPHLAAGPLLARGLHGGASSSVPRSSLSPQRHLLRQRGLHSYTYPGASGIMPPSTSNMHKLALAGLAAIPLTLLYYSRSTISEKSQEDKLAEVVDKVAEVAASLANTVKNGAEVTASLAYTVEELAEDICSVAATVKELAEDTSTLAKVVEKQAAAIKDLEAELKEQEDATKDWKTALALQAEIDQLRAALNRTPTEGKGKV